MELIKKNAKAVVAVLMIAVVYIATALGVDVGIDVDQWWSVLGHAIFGGAAVWAIPNSDSEVKDD